MNRAIPSASAPAPPLRRVLVWIAILYFAQGLPFGLTSKVWPVYFRQHGLSLTDIGLLSLLALPWSWKPLWAPLVDRFGSRQVWIGGGLAVLGAASFLLPRFDPTTLTASLLACLFAFTLASATQDIAIDAFAVDWQTPENAGALNGVRAGAFRVAMLVGSGALIALAGLWGWRATWWTVGLAFWLLAAAALLAPRRRRGEATAAERWSFRRLLGWLLRREMLPVLLFVPLYKLGDGALSRMVEPFWVDAGMSLAEIGLISNALGAAFTVAGALAGGWFLTRYGMFPGLVWMGVGQAVSNLGYVAVAALPTPVHGAIYAAALFESFTQGLGTAAFLAFLTACCERAQAATQFALLSALFALSRELAGAVSGLGAERLGYAGYFAATALVALPGLALLPWIRPLLPERAPAVSALE